MMSLWEVIGWSALLAASAGEALFARERSPWRAIGVIVLLMFGIVALLEAAIIRGGSSERDGAAQASVGWSHR